MKNLIFILIGLTGLSAHAGSFGYSGTMECEGVVSTDSASGSSIKLEITWGQVSAEPGSLPPYSIDQEQAAAVKVSIDGRSGTSNIEFKQSGGTTRCEWWDSSVAMITLNHGQYAYDLEFDHRSQDSGCGQHPLGVFLTDLNSTASNQKIELNCQQKKVQAIQTTVLSSSLFSSVNECDPGWHSCSSRTGCCKN